jgi:hypothetical protein
VGMSRKPTSNGEPPAGLGVHLSSATRSSDPTPEPVGRIGKQARRDSLGHRFSKWYRGRTARLALRDATYLSLLVSVVGVFIGVTLGLPGFLQSVGVMSPPAPAGLVAAPAPQGDLLAESVLPQRGDWWHHGFLLTIRDKQLATAQWRTYEWRCDQQTRRPCDRIAGDVINDGGIAQLVFSRAVGSTAEGFVVESNDPDMLAEGPVQLTFLPFGLARLQPAFGVPLTLCSEREAGASLQKFGLYSPCGA